MTTFAERMALAGPHEQAVLNELTGRGLSVEPFGQALLSAGLRDALRTTDSLMRWLPDIAGWRPGKPKPFLVDAKNCITTKTENHSIEMRALLAARITMLPVFYVCDDYRALSAAAVFDDGPDGHCCSECWALACDDPWGRALPTHCPDHKRRGRRGTGTPYVLVRRERCVPLERIFGSVVAGEV